MTPQSTVAPDSTRSPTPSRERAMRVFGWRRADSTAPVRSRSGRCRARRSPAASTRDSTAGCREMERAICSRAASTTATTGPPTGPTQPIRTATDIRGRSATWWGCRRSLRAASALRSTAPVASPTSAICFARIDTCDSSGSRRAPASRTWMERCGRFTRHGRDWWSCSSPGKAKAKALVWIAAAQAGLGAAASGSRIPLVTAALQTHFHISPTLALSARTALIAANPGHLRRRHPHARQQRNELPLPNRRRSHDHR